jgi:hypothetical protein
MNSVVRVGATVRRVAGPWTPSVHALLDWLRAHGAGDVAPRGHGFDERGREVLDYVPGVVANHPMPAWVWSEAALVGCARLLRSVHDASTGFLESPAGAVAEWQLPAREPAEVICHNDAAPYNTVFRDGLPVALIDWDTAAPGPRIRDLAYLAYRVVPFLRDAEPEAPTGTARVARLDALIAAYGFPYSRRDVLTAMAGRLDELADFSDRRADEAAKPELRLHAAMYRADAAAIRAETFRDGLHAP